ncbi:hypothetical protein [Ancylobacter sp. SL191]|uniref:hypothetical protein n=1 Tax=Ancylobacter sp. SL191 TaxID=2995166 RepID=UPI00226E2DC1|nr:hypothetical protein [Ancylobacter sp. SL191]WAC28540.1 hypothetical protein OU996_05670 [Ancylobacter sp. SL191]
MSHHKHLVITGTGRAGTSFLVQYLHANGFDTHLGRNPDAQLDDAANAGLEDLLLPGQLDDLPYVVKSPWIAFDPASAIPPQVTVDAFIVPVRALEEAAASRVLVERTAIHRAVPWMADLPESFHQWGTVPGGMVHTLNAMDQARILAVGFHTLVHYAVQKDIPVVFLDFPRFIEDGEYLAAKLSAVLPLQRERAMAAHAALSDPSLVRTGREVQAGLLSDADADRLAIARELQAARRQVAQTQARLEEMGARLANQTAAMTVSAAMNVNAYVRLRSWWRQWRRARRHRAA